MLWQNTAYRRAWNLLEAVVWKFASLPRVRRLYFAVQLQNPGNRKIRSRMHHAYQYVAGPGVTGTPRGTPRGGNGSRKQRPDAVPLERQLRRGLTALARAVALEALGLSASVAGGAQTVLQVSCFPGAQLTFEAERPLQASTVSIRVWFRGCAASQGYD